MSRWLLVTGDLPPTFTGGIASWVDDLARALVAGGHQVRVLGRGGRGEARAAEAAWDADQPYAVHRFWARSWSRWQAAWVDLHGRGLLADADQLVFATWPLASRLGPRARARALPVAIAFHGSDLSRLAQASPAFHAAVDAATALLPVSHFLGTELTRLGARPTAVLPMPLRLPPPPLDRPREGLLCVARLTPLKGVDRAIGLARALGLPLTVIGDGPASASLRRLAGPETRFLGRLERAETAGWYARSQACVLLSRADQDGSGAEGLGLTLIEAMAHGTVAIGSSTGGVPEATGPGLVLADPDDPDLRAVRGLLADDAAGPRARAWVEAHHGPARARAVLEAALGLSRSDA